MKTRTKTQPREIRPLIDTGRSRYDEQGREITTRVEVRAATNAAAPQALAGDVLSAFVRLADRDNSISLVGLRKACSLGRDAFDRQLRSLRVSGVLTCSSADRYVSQAELAAGVREHGEVLTHVSRREE